MHKIWFLNCREVSRMVSLSMDVKLPWTKRAGVRFHLMMCKYCARFRDQLEQVRQLMKARENELSLQKMSPEAKERIKAALGSPKKS